MYNNDFQFFIDCGLPFKSACRVCGKRPIRISKCEICKKSFSYIQHTRCKRFCSVCVRKGIEGTDRTRLMVRARDNFTCQDCGAVRTPETAKKEGKRLFDVHHLNGLCGKKSRSYDRVKDMDGLITLCHKCHFNRPEHKSNKKYLKKI